MKKHHKVIAIIIAGLCALAVIGRVFYMVICISCTSPPIETYKFHGTVEDLDSSLQKFANANPTLTYKFSRRDSTAKEDNGSRDLEIELKKDTSIISYGLVCEENDNTTEIKLVSAFSRYNTYGGYIKEAPGVKELVEYFEKGFVSPLKKEEHVEIKPE